MKQTEQLLKGAGLEKEIYTLEHLRLMTALDGSKKLIFETQFIKALNNLKNKHSAEVKRLENFMEKKNKKIKDKPVGEVLLTQNLFSGLGNIYKCETMYEIEIDPRLATKDVSKTKWNQVNLVAHKIMQNAYFLGGSSVKNFTANGVEGYAQTTLKIYGKKKCPLGHEVSTIKQGKGSNERTTWFCKQCIQST